jgi:hypothetical protein
MFSRPDFHDAVSDITTLLAEQALGPADCDDDARARLLQIRQAITAQPREPGRRRSWWPGRPLRRHRRAVIACVAVPVLAGATAAGWAIAVSPPASYVTNEVGCYSGKYLPGTFLDHSQSVYMTISDGTPPTTLCARAWSRGDVIGNPHSHFVPPLTACVLPSAVPLGFVQNTGAVGVFPDTTCARLHLPPLPPGYDRAARRLFTLDNYLTSGAENCMSRTVADRFVRRALDKFGYQSWRVTQPWGTHPRGFPPDACWEGQPDSSVHAIQVLPEPGAPTPARRSTR